MANQDFFPAFRRSEIQGIPQLEHSRWVLRRWSSQEFREHRKAEPWRWVERPGKCFRTVRLSESYLPSSHSWSRPVWARLRGQRPDFLRRKGDGSLNLFTVPFMTPEPLKLDCQAPFQVMRYFTPAVIPPNGYDDEGEYLPVRSMHDQPMCGATEVAGLNQLIREPYNPHRGWRDDDVPRVESGVSGCAAGAYLQSSRRPELEDSLGSSQMPDLPELQRARELVRTAVGQDWWDEVMAADLEATMPMRAMPHTHHSTMPYFEEDRSLRPFPLVRQAAMEANPRAGVPWFKANVAGRPDLRPPGAPVRTVSALPPRQKSAVVWREGIPPWVPKEERPTLGSPGLGGRTVEGFGSRTPRGCFVRAPRPEEIPGNWPDRPGVRGWAVFDEAGLFTLSPDAEDLQQHVLQVQREQRHPLPAYRPQDYTNRVVRPPLVELVMGPQHSRRYRRPRPVVMAPEDQRGRRSRVRWEHQPLQPPNEYRGMACNHAPFEYICQRPGTFLVSREGLPQAQAGPIAREDELRGDEWQISQSWKWPVPINTGAVQAGGMGQALEKDPTDIKVPPDAPPGMPSHGEGIDYMSYDVPPWPPVQGEPPNWRDARPVQVSPRPNWNAVNHVFEKLHEQGAYMPDESPRSSPVSSRQGSDGWSDGFSEVTDPMDE